MENCNLKYRFARDIVNDLNERLYSAGKPRAYMVARAFGGEDRHFVASTDTNANTNSPKMIQGVKQQGITLAEARNEVVKINRLICETARYPKAWVVVAVDGSWSGGDGRRGGAILSGTLTPTSEKLEPDGLSASKLYRREGLMKALGIGQRGLQKLIEQGLPHVTLIGRQYFPGRLVVEWFEAKAK